MGIFELSRPFAVAAALALLATVAAAQDVSKSDPDAAKPEAAADPAPKADADDSRGLPREPERIVKTDEEWRKLLTRDQFLVTRMKATEPPFSGRYAVGHFKGTFLCVCCGARLFDSRAKFDSGTGWPSFWRPVEAKALAQAYDHSEAELRIEVTCARCGAHLGHVFDDGPAPTGLRYCINSLAIKLEPDSPRSASRSRP